MTFTMWDSPYVQNRENKCVRYSRLSVSVIVVLIIVGYIGFPFVFRYSNFAKTNLTFMNLVKVPLHVDFRKPADLGLVGARNFYLKTEDGVTLGVWHTIPVALHEQAASLDLSDPYNATVLATYNSWLRGSTVILYCHGSGGSRASRSRVKLYKLLNRLGYHVIAFDYRGYGDSSHRPKTETEVVRDANTVYSWLSRHVTTGHIFFWGHSLGSGVLSHLLSDLEQSGRNRAMGVVMESSFNNMAEELSSYPPSLPYAKLPLFDFFAVEPMNMYGLTFRSDEFLKNVSSPMLFLHAEDDMVVPYKLGLKLYQSVVASRADPTTVSFVGFAKELGHGHLKMHDDPNLGPIIQNFIEKSISGTDLK